MTHKDPIYHVCPRGHNMLEYRPDNDYDSRYHCTDCARRRDTWGHMPDFSAAQIYPVSAPPEPEGTVADSVGDLGRRLNIHVRMVPIERWQYSRLHIGLGIADYTDSIVNTVQTFRLRDVHPSVARYADVPEDPSQSDMSTACADRLWLSHHVQPLSDTHKKRRIYCNPDYVHYESCGPAFAFNDPDEALTYWTMMYATLGRVPRHIVRRNLGIESVYDYDPQWDKRREIGRRWMANTYKVFLEWADCSLTKAARALGTTHSVITEYIDAYCELDDVPPDPSVSNAFCRDAKTGPEWKSIGGEA